MAHRIIFWKPKSGIEVWLPASRPLGESILDTIRRGEPSTLLQPFQATAFLNLLSLGFPGSRFDDEGRLHWTDELDNGFVAHAYKQHVELCLFDAEDADIAKVFRIATEIDCGCFL